MSSKIIWDEQPLGKMPDHTLAHKLKTSKDAVGSARRRRNIPVYNVPTSEINWNDQPFGQDFDYVLAGKLGVSRKIVSYHRRKIGEKSFHSTEVDWDLQPLGKVSDRDLKDKLGVNRENVISARKTRGIKAFVPKHEKPKRTNLKIADNITKLLIKLYEKGQVDRLLAEAVTPDGKILWDNIPYGDVPDDYIARRIDKSVGTVTYQRTNRNIKSLAFRFEEILKSLSWK